MSDAQQSRFSLIGDGAAETLRVRELEVVRELAQAFLTASTPLQVYRLALDRVTPLVQADFSSVFLRDPGDAELLKLVCAHNWPQASALFLGQLRIRVGRGPTGTAVADGEPVEVADVFADPALTEWWEPARELGFASMITLPLRVRGRVEGALSFYFEEARRFQRGERDLLSLIADQLAATAEKAHLIDDLQAANERLRRQNEELVRKVREAETSRQLKNEFLANISHELRTPLTSILGYTYLLQGGLAGSMADKQREAVEKIDIAAGVLLRLIGDLISLSQLKLGRVPLDARPEDAVELAERAAAASGAPADGVSFDIDAPEGRLPLRTDGEKVCKILENLVSNAFKFTPTGEVRLSVRRVDPRQEARIGLVRSGAALAGGGEGAEAHAAGWIEWTVRDTGIGISGEKLDSVFDEFRQVDGSSTRLYGGTGLGLALSLRLARLLGGDIGVASEAGKGSTFTLRLPERGPGELAG